MSAPDPEESEATQDSEQLDSQGSKSQMLSQTQNQPQSPQQGQTSPHQTQDQAHPSSPPPGDKQSSADTFDEIAAFDTEAFSKSEHEFQQVLTELVGDKSLDRFRVEYEKLHRALKKSHESEKRLIKRLRLWQSCFTYIVKMP